MAIDFDLTPDIPFVLTLPANATVNDAGEVECDLSLDGLDAADLTLSNLTSAATARTNLGGTATGVAVFIAENAAAAATAVGASVTGAALLTAANAAAAATAVGATAAGAAILTATTAADQVTALGGTVDGAALFTAVDVPAQLAALGVSPTTDVDLKSDIHLMGPVVVDLDSTGFLAAVRWRPGFAGTIARLTMTISAEGPIAGGAGDVTVTIAGVACTTTDPLSAPIASAVSFVVDTDVTAGGAFTADQEIAVIPSGANTATTFAGIGIEYTRA